MMILKITSKQFFFDRQKVIRSIGKGRAIFYTKAGAMVRGNARRIVRYAKKAPPHPSPGPPRSRVTGDEFGLRNILYAYSMMHQGQIVGPVGKAITGGTTVPEAHEHGRPKITKVPMRIDKRLPRNWRRHGARSRRKVKMIYVDYPFRPFMKPALAMAIPKLPGLWKNSVKV